MISILTSCSSKKNHKINLFYFGRQFYLIICRSLECLVRTLRESFFHPLLCIGQHHWITWHSILFVQHFLGFLVHKHVLHHTNNLTYTNTDAKKKSQYCISLKLGWLFIVTNIWTQLGHDIWTLQYVFLLTMTMSKLSTPLQVYVFCYMLGCC